ncbi:P-loop domain-containing protein [Nocardia gipuzkoensis]
MRRIPRTATEFEYFIDHLLEKAGTPPRQRPTAMATWERLRRNAARARGSKKAWAGLVGSSLYLAQVREFLAPIDGLRYRGDELEMLADFCRGDQPYLWIQGPPWAGKTALLATFVLNPPPDLTVIGFFVTNRLAAQRDHTAFTTAVLDQLAVLLPDQRDRIHAGAVTRDGLRAELLTLAAGREAAAGRRLVLVVDGLDEDHGRPPIVNLLPARPGDDLRVVVTSRHGPRLPIAHGHPLAAASRYQLTDSEYAAGIRDLAIPELDSLLDGPDHHRDLLALITAANGLTIGELEELTDLAPYEIHPLLDGVTGRSFRTFTSTDGHDHADPVYALAHESLFEIAQRRLGTRLLAASRDRLHAWAQDYRTKHWPPDTPEYLLRRYFNMLHTTGDVARMVACATDIARRDRLLDLSGGDAAALTEITTTQDVIAAHAHPDVIAMLRLAIHRDHLTNQNKNIPPHLPAVWALLGQVNRAEAIARSIPNRYVQASALVSLIEIVARAGDLNHAVAIADSIADLPAWQASVLASVAGAAGRADSLDRAATLIARAETIADSITKPDQQTGALASVAEAAVAAGDLDRAATLIARAETIARSVTDHYEQAYALVSLVETAARAGDLDRAEAIANSITDPERRARALMLLAEAAGEAGDLNRAEAIANSITDRYWQTKGLASAAGAVARTGDLDRAATLIARAETIADSITKPELKAWDLVSVADAAAKAGDFDRAGALIARAETIARSIPADSRMMLDQQTRVLVSVAEAAAKVGDLDRAEAIADSITVFKQQVWALASVAEVLARDGDFDRAGALIARAEALARSIPDPFRQQRAVHALASVADAATDAGDLDGAGALIARAEALARSITSPQDQATAMLWVAKAVAKTGDLDRAMAVAGAIADLYTQAWALEALGEVVARAGDFVRAGALIARAEALARSLGRSLTQPSQQDRYQRARALESSAQAAAEALGLGRAEAAAKAGDLDRAEALADSLPDSEQQARVLVSMAEAVVRAGDVDRVGALTLRAEAIAHSIPSTWPFFRDPFEQARAVRILALVADAMATVGDVDRAGALIVRAETITHSITDPDQQARALVSVADAVATVGDVDQAGALIMRAETIAHSATNPYLVPVAEAAAKIGDLDRAETITNSIDFLTTPNDYVQALLTVTATQDLPRRAHAVAQALRITDWHIPIRQLIEIAPEAPTAVITEFDALTRPDAS